MQWAAARLRPAPAPAPVHPPDPGRSWSAEIGWQQGAEQSRFRVVAHAAGRDPQVVAESQWLEWPPRDAATVGAMSAATREIEQLLISSGWARDGADEPWYAKRFTWSPAEVAAQAGADGDSDGRGNGHGDAHADGDGNGHSNGQATAAVAAPRAPAKERRHGGRAHPLRRRPAPSIAPPARFELLAIAVIVALGALLRVWKIDAVGLNSDEAVYAGQGASIAGVTELEPYFPTFRAHPLLFQTFVSLGFKLGHPELFGRLLAAAFGVGTVLVTWQLARMLYGRRAGIIAALLLALMPYHVVVTRQILLDGPMVFWSTVTLYLLARYALTQRPLWFHAAAAGMALTFLSKEGSVILLAAFYAFLALTPAVRIRWRTVLGAALVFAVIVSAFPLALMVAGQTKTGGNFLAWQLFRRPNHSFLFYPAVVPVAIGLLVVLAAALGVWLLRRRGSWRETLLLSWIAVPAAFFQVFPIKGFQYLLPIAPAVAVLAARFLAAWPDRVPLGPRLATLRRPWVAPATLCLVGASLAFASWRDVQPSKASTFLAGSGGVPGGREAGRWIARNVPEGARMMTVGPSMANILQYYGHRKIYGLSVSPNPLHRNPVYDPMQNPDRMIRDHELQYVVWDAFSAGRSPFFSRKILRYVERYHGTVAHAQTVPVKTAQGRPARKPVIVIYEVRP